MKTKLLTMLLAFLSVAAFAQKKEIRNAEKAAQEGNYAQAKSILEQLEPQISNEKDNVQADFYAAKGLAYLGGNEGADLSLEELRAAAEAYQKLVALGKQKEGQNGLLAVSNALINSAIADQNAEKYDLAAEKLYQRYMFRPQDTIYLYYAANAAVTGQDYDTAADYFGQLLEMGYSGIETQYIATDKATGKTRVFGSEQERDIYIKSGEYIKPESQKTESKTADVAKTLAQIYIHQDKPELAMKAIEKAKAANPGDLAIMKVEANVYYKLDKLDKYNEITREVIKQDPENADLYYNLAVTSADMGDDESAIGFYKKAIEFDPEMMNAYVNLAAVILKEEGEIVEEMNKMLEEKNDAGYDALEQKRKEVFKEALPYLEEAYKMGIDDVEVVRTMMNIYYVLGQTTKAEEMQAKIKEME